MFFIKTLALIAVFSSSTMLGNIISNKYKNRTINLNEMKKALNYFETKIEYTYEPLKEIFIDISNLVNVEIGSIFKIAGIKLDEMNAKEAWEHSVDISNISLKDKDIEIIRELRKNARTN